MISRGLSRFRVGSAKKEKQPNPPIPPPHPTTLTNPTIRKAKTLSDRSSTSEPAPASKPSGLDQALRLIHPRTSRPSKAKLKIAPSGAIVFTPAQSQESLRSSILPGKVLSYVHRYKKLMCQPSRNSDLTTYRLEYCKTSINARPRLRRTLCKTYLICSTC